MKIANSCTKIRDFSSIKAFNLTNYSIAYGSTISNILSDVAESDMLECIESKLTETLFTLVIKNSTLPNVNIFELALDVVNEECSTTFIIKDITVVNNYMDVFKTFLVNSLTKADITGSYYYDFDISDNIGYKLFFTEGINNDIRHREKFINRGTVG